MEQLDKLEGKRDTTEPIIPKGLVLRAALSIVVALDRPKSIRLLSKETKMSTRSIHRYILLLNDVGFVIDQCRTEYGNKYKLVDIPEALKKHTAK